MENNNSSIFYEEDLCECGMSYNEEIVYKEIRWWLEGCIQIFFNLFGLIGNVISIPVLLSKEQKGIFYMTLTILTFFDSIFNVTDILESIRKIHYDRSSCAEMSFTQGLHLLLWPQFLYPLRSIAMICSIYMTVVLAIERYIAVSRPFVSYTASNKRTWKSMIRYTFVMVVVLVGCNGSLFAEFTVETQYYECSINDSLKGLQLNKSTYEERLLRNAEYGPKNDFPLEVAVEVIQWTDLRIDPDYIACYKTAFQALLTGIIPLVALSIMNYLIYKHIRKRRQEWGLSGFNLHHGRYKREEMHTRMLFGIVVTFFFGHSLRIMMDIQELIDINKQHNNPYEVEDCNYHCASTFSLWSKLAILLQTLLMSLSHSVNLPIYCLSNPGFRRRIYRKYQRKSVYSRNSESNSTPSGFRMSRLTSKIRNTISKDTSASNVENATTLDPTQLNRSISERHGRHPPRIVQSKTLVDSISTNKDLYLHATFKTNKTKSNELKRGVSV